MDNSNTIQIDASLANAPAIEQAKAYTLTCPANQWAKYKQLKAQASAADNQAKAIEKAWGWPSPDDLATTFKLAIDSQAEEAEGTVIPIIDGNGTPLGKLSLFHYPGASIPPGWRKRIS